MGMTSKHPTIQNCIAMFMIDISNISVLVFRYFSQKA